MPKIALVPIVAALIAILAQGAHAQDTEATPRPAKVVTVESTSPQVIRRYPALVHPSHQVQLSFRVDGRLIELPVRGAMTVQEGDVIAQLDPTDFQNQLLQLESQRDQALAQLDTLRSGARPEEISALEAAVQAAQAQVDQAIDQVERTRTLVDRGVAAATTLDQQEANLRVAEATLRAQSEQLLIGQRGARAEDIASAEASIRGIEAQLAVAQNNLDNATLRAPFSGVIASRSVENFTNVQTGQDIALLQALDTVHLAFNVPGPDVTALSRIAPENVTTEVEFNALPGQVFPGEVVEFSAQADAASQTYHGRVALPVPAGSIILPGMVGRVVTTATIPGQELTLPVSAIASDPSGQPFVWVVRADNSVLRSDVDLGELGQTHVVVTDGLEPGDTVVAAGVSQIIDGMTIRPIAQVGG